MDIVIKEGYFLLDNEPIEEKRKKLKVERGGLSVMYDITDYNVFPFQFGCGDYNLTLYRQVSGNKYKIVETKTLKNVQFSQFAPYLDSNQYVDYSKTPLSSTRMSIDDFKTYIKNNFRYDYVRAFTTKKTLLPDINYVIKHGMGTCQDLAAYVAAKLRVMGIPARLIIGYGDNVYHAWVEYYLNTEGKWIQYDPTAEVTGRKVKKYTIERWY